uniref:DNA-directed RNA polymerase I subunit rpa49 n=1 Tax=Lotus japonicus TaxID=34305 RepID=I3SLR3_LOTJA|nr:unknown [Lotus japonicus]
MTKRLQLVVSPAGAPVEFVGTSYTGEAAAGHRAMYALGVFDKKAQTLKVVPIAANKIFRLEPKVKALEALDKEPAISTVEELTPADSALKQRQTTAMLGTKRDIERNRRKDALRQGDDPESQKNLGEKVKDVAVNKEALESTEVHVSRNLPPYDASATTPQEAYILDKIIPKKEWEYLEDIYDMLQLGEEADFSAYPTFISNRIARLKGIKDEAEKKKMSCIFSYLNHLIKFKDQRTMQGVSSAKSHKIPPILRYKFSSMFGATESRRLPNDELNLLICYVLVLTLFSDEFRTDYTDISKDLRMSVLLVRQHYSDLGCKFLSQNKISYATLPVPLKFPDSKQRKRKR